MNHKLLYIILTVILLGFAGFLYFNDSPKFFYKKGNNSEEINNITIEHIAYETDCSIGITLSNNELVTINPLSENMSCDNNFAPQISSDKKYGVVEVRGLQNQTEKNNQIIVYFANHRDWVTVYEFGAAYVKEMAIDNDNNVSLVATNDEISEKKQIILPVIDEQFDAVVDRNTKKINYSESFLPAEIIKTLD